MPTNPPPKPDVSEGMSERRIAEFALEESRLSNVAYRFRISPRSRVWKNWDRTEFEPNHYQVLGIAGVCLTRDEAGEAQKVASRALSDVDDIVYTPIKEGGTRMAALLAGNIDFVLDPPVPRRGKDPFGGIAWLPT